MIWVVAPNISHVVFSRSYNVIQGHPRSTWSWIEILCALERVFHPQHEQVLLLCDSFSCLTKTRASLVVRPRGRPYMPLKKSSFWKIFWSTTECSEFEDLSLIRSQETVFTSSKWPGNLILCISTIKII